MTTMATACSAASSGCAAARRRRTSPAWASASGEPRVPRRRSGFAVMALALDHGPSDENRSPAPRSQSRPGGVRSGAMTRPAETMIVAPKLTVLGIETSCDETAAAVVSGSGEIRANLVLSQLDEHRPYGGVVPEIAARSHLDHIDRLIAEAMQQAGLEFAELDGIAATAGPGLIGGVFVGVMTAKAIALAWDRPFLAVNHLEGHALSARLSDKVPFPYLLLLVSGGHCQLLAVEGVGRYRRLGGTIDDAVGEARSEERRVGKECGSTSGSRVSRYHRQKNTKTTRK